MKRLLLVPTLLGLLLATIPASAFAAAPIGGEELVVPLLALCYFVLLVVAISTALIGVKWGAFRDPEGAKYYMLTIDEPDYYSDDWEKEAKHATRSDDRPAADRG